MDDAYIHGWLWRRVGLFPLQGPNGFHCHAFSHLSPITAPAREGSEVPQYRYLRPCMEDNDNIL